jgi:large subunit ribosomal protein L19
MIASSLEKMASVSAQNLRKDLPMFDVGDTVKMKTGIGLGAAFTVRKISFGEGVERTFPVHSPVIDKIEVVSKGVIKRAKLYYLRDRLGKKARVQVDQSVVQ